MKTHREAIEKALSFLRRSQPADAENVLNDRATERRD